MNQHWHWQTWQDYDYLTCDLLSSWQHGFFTQKFYPRSPEELTNIWEIESTTLRVKQVHGNVVLTPAEIANQLKPEASHHSLAEADGIISDRRKQSVWAASADCTPILIGDLTTGQVCSIHAGWRGTAKKIASVAIARLMEFGSKKSDLRVGIGPAISGKIYQVDEYVAIEVGRSIIDDPQLEDAVILNQLKQLPDSPLFEDSLPGKVRLDVPKINQIQLEQLGLNPAQIAIAPYCTFQESDLFFSYRRTGEKKVQWSGILA